MCARWGWRREKEKGGGIIEGGGRASNGAPRVRAFIIMIILDIPCLKQGQPASQPAKLSLLSFPILILFLPGRSGRHISRSGHKIHSPFQSPSPLLPPPRLPHPLPVRGKRDGDRGENYPYVCASLFIFLGLLFSISFCFPLSLSLSLPAERLRWVLLLINGEPAIFFLCARSPLPPPRIRRVPPAD